MRNWLAALSSICAVSMLAVQPASCQINKINSVVFGTRVPTFLDDPSGGMPFRQAASDFSAQVPYIAGAKLIMISPDGRTFLTANGANAWLWTTGGQEVQALTHSYTISAVAFAQNGAYVVISGGTEARIWSQAGQFRGLLKHPSVIRQVVISPDGRYIACVTANGFTIWNAEGANERVNMPTDTAITQLLFSPDSTRFVTLSGNNANLYLVSDGARVGSIPHQSPIRAAVFSLDGQYLLTGTDQWALLWDAKRFAQITQIQYGAGNY